eukprot:TRINITY_DN91276_c0_g1_i1.p1 TRINITY_DN91276_c0_g1~~TRINITY_DN91276_c0_g1_i1.p1  ORF type:complete len:264 (-),score=39.53 TRINITY_DN91276_c0_g1_i1:243-956(-)
MPSGKAMHAKGLFEKTVLCKFHAEGKCLRGEGCRFAHDDEELQPSPDLSCTRMCKVLQTQGACYDSSCRFAHSRRELRAVHREGIRARDGSLGLHAAEATNPQGARPLTPNYAEQEGASCQTPATRSHTGVSTCSTMSASCEAPEFNVDNEIRLLCESLAASEASDVDDESDILQLRRALAAVQGVRRAPPGFEALHPTASLLLDGPYLPEGFSHDWLTLQTPHDEDFFHIVGFMRL